MFGSYPENDVLQKKLIKYWNSTLNFQIVIFSKFSSKIGQLWNVRLIHRSFHKNRKNRIALYLLLLEILPKLIEFETPFTLL